MTTALRARATSTKRTLQCYFCPKCKRNIKRVGKPKRCCNVRLIRIGSVNETVANEREDGDG